MFQRVVPAMGTRSQFQSSPADLLLAWPRVNTTSFSLCNLRLNYSVIVTHLNLWVVHSSQLTLLLTVGHALLLSCLALDAALVDP